MSNYNIYQAVGIGLLLLSGCTVNNTTNPSKTTPTSAQGLSPTEVALQYLNALPPSVGGTYKCKNMVHSVNSLRHLGAERAISVLSDYLQTGHDFEKERNVTCICRLLFVSPPGGWGKPSFGQPFPFDMDQTAIPRFPTFPLVVVDSVPFMIVEGYLASGILREGTDSIAQCTKLRLRDSDLADSGFVNAARKIIADETFQSLYPRQSERAHMSELLLKQAE
jgi:hypothetical protein